MIRHLSARPVMKESAGASAESADPQLAAALRLAAAAPSAENHLRVAHEYLRLGILDTAYTYANRAVLQKPRFAEAHEVLARIWRDWGLPGSGSDRHRARPTSIRRRRRRRTRSGRCSTRSASLPRHGGRSHARWRSTRAPRGR